jgi:hypothetical protein
LKNSRELEPISSVFTVQRSRLPPEANPKQF